MKRYIFSLLIFVAMVGFTSCNNSESDDPDPEPSKKDLLTQDWQVEDVTRNGSDVSGNYSFSFDSDNSFSMSTNDDNLSGIPGSGQWAFNSNETMVIINEGEAELAIMALEEDELILEYQYENYKEGEVTYRFTFN